ncbi:MAG: CHAD domain-containing protein [Planctomycetota bacterium]|nr:CHAD domain-containing protein [Planctomycetota bacterium]
MNPKPTSLATGAFLRDSLKQLGERLDAACKAVPEVEGVHQVRVSARRLRSLLSLFRDYLPPGARQVRDRLRELADAFSALRDLDVLFANFDEWHRELPGKDANALLPLLQRLAERREQLLPEAQVALEAWRASPEFELLQLLALPRAEWPAAAKVSIDSVAPDLLEVAHGRFRKALERARRRRTLEEYHRLRIAGKKLRYALMALAGHYGEPAKPTLKALAAIQEGFGDYLDASHAADVLSHLSAEPEFKPATRRACAKLVEICRERARAHLAEMPELLDELDSRRWAEVLEALTGRKRRKR